MLSLFVSAVLAVLGLAINEENKRKQEEAANEESAAVATKTADDLERDAETMLTRATEQADYYDETADALMEGYETTAGNLDRQARDQESFIKEQLQRIISSQRVGIAGAGFKVKSATTEVLAKHSTEKANQDITQMWENTKGEKRSIYNQMMVDYNYYTNEAETLRTTSQEDYNAMIEDAEWYRDLAEGYKPPPKGTQPGDEDFVDTGQAIYTPW